MSPQPAISESRALATTATKAGSDVRDSAPPLVGRAWTGLAVPLLLVLIGGLPSGGAEAQAPTVNQIVFRGLGASDSTYYRGEVVRVRVRFSQHVTVDTSGGEPYVDLTIGSTTRRADFGSSRQNYLDFRYRVQEGDYDDDGVSVPANGLTLNGAVVTAKDNPAVVADPAHGLAEGGLSRKVDGSQVRPPDPTLSAAGASVAEGGAGAETDLEFAVRLSPAAGARVTVDYSDAGSGTATSGEDYAAIEGGTLTFEPGDTLKTVWVKVRGDDAEEDDETVVLALSGATNAELATRTVRGTIVDDDDAPPALTVNQIVFRGLGASDSTYYRGEVVRVRVRFSQHVTVDTSGGEPYVDLTIGSTTRRANFGSSRQNYLGFSYRVQADDFDSDGVSVPANSLTLNGATVTAKDNPAVVADPAHGLAEGGLSRKVDGSQVRPPGPAVARVDFRGLAEGDSTYYRGEIVRVRVFFTQRIAVDASDGLPSVDLTVGAETRQAVMGPRSWNQNRLELRYTVQEGDYDADGVSVQANSLALNGAVITAQNDASARADTAHGAVDGGVLRKVDGGRIRPQGPTLSAGGASVLEGGTDVETELEFEVWLGPPATTRVTVDYADAGSGMATSGEDYAAIEGGTLTFEPGETLKTVSVTVLGDDELEGDETLVLALSGAANAELATRSVTGTIVDDDGPRPTVSIDPVSVQERGPEETATLSFTVSLSAPTARQVTVRYRDAGTGTATPGDDYDPVTPGTLVFAAEDTAQTLNVTVQGDAMDEPAETIVLALANAFNADLPVGGATGVGTIVDDDDAPTLSGDSPSVEEGNSGGRRLTFALALDRPSGHGLAVHYADADTGTATSGADYEAVSPDTLFFEPGETTKSISVMVMGDTLQERDETVVLRLSALDPALVAISETLITGRIRDDDGDDLVPSFGDASVPSQRWIRACEIPTLQLPPAEGGDAPLTYGLAPAPPPGLKFDAERRTIAGTPMQEQPLTTYRYTATDEDGDSATLSFAAQVDLADCVFEGGDAEPEENRPPEVVSAIAPMTIDVASPAAVVDLSAHFRDPDGDELRYSAVSAAPRSVRADLASSALKVEPLAVGESLVTVRATDTDGAEAEQSFTVTVDASRADRARIMKRSLAAFGRAVGTETVEAIGGRLGAVDDRPGATAGEAHLEVGGRSLSCISAGERCDLEQLARQAAGVLGLRASHGAGSLTSALWAAAKGSQDAGALRGLAGAFGRPGEIDATAGLGATNSFGPTAGFGSASGYGAADPVGHVSGRHGGRAGWGRLVSVDPVSREELLARSSFRFSPGAGQRATPGGWTFWGQANAGGFKGRPEDDLALDGTVRSAYLGADYRFGTGPLVGLALSRTTSSIGFESGINGTGTVDARLTSLYPYAQWSPRAGLSLWGLVGAGRGTAELSEDATGRDFATNIGMAMTAAGVRQRLTGVLAVKADAFAVGTDAEEVRGLAGVVANVQRLRLASEVGGRWDLSGGSAITSRVELGARFDGGDAETGAGAEAGAGLGYVHDGIGLSVDAQGRTLVAHQASSLREWGASVAVRLQPSREAGGLSFTVEPTWGNAASGMAMLWRDGPTGGTGAGGAALGASSAWQAGGGPLAGGRAGASAGRLRMEMDYGIVLPDGGRVAPFGRWAAESGSARRLNVGVRLSVLAAATLDLFGEQVSGGAQPADRRLGLQGAVRFR